MSQFYGFVFGFQVKYWLSKLGLPILASTASSVLAHQSPAAGLLVPSLPFAMVITAAFVTSITACITA